VPSIRDIVHASGEVINAVPRDQVDAVLRTQLRQFIPAPFRIEGGVVTDGNGTKTEAFSALICVGGQLLDADGSKAIVPIDYVAAVIDATHTLDLNSLASAYSRVSAAKALKKTIPAPGNQTIEPTLGMIFSVNATASLEELADELVRLNARTPSEHWPDALVVANKGQICYMVQWVGDKEVSGLEPEHSI